MARFAPDEMARALGKSLLAFPITPFNDDLTIDHAAYGEHLTWLLGNQPGGIFAAGGTGEFFSLSVDEVEKIVSTTVAVVDGRVPVLAPVGCGYGTARELVMRAERAGADGILLFPPSLALPSQEGLANHIEAVCKATSLGVVVYNRDNATLDHRTVAELCARCPNLVGLKDGVGDIENMVRIEAALGDRLLLVGGLPTAELFALPYLTMGVTTYSSALFNFMPNFARGFYRAVRARDVEAVSKGLADFILPYTAIRNRGQGYAVSIVKAGARLVGRPSGPVRPPLTDLDERSLADLKALIASVGDRELEVAS